jgi:hypothetical protein
MKFYKIKHNPTGLFYQPSSSIKRKGIGYCKTNLSKKGKVYPSLGHTQSALKHILHYGYYNPEDATEKNHRHPPVRNNCSVEEFSIIDYEAR